MTEKRRYCPDCERWVDFDKRLEGNLRTGEQWEIVSCPLCRWVDEKKRVRCAVIRVTSDRRV